MSQPSTPMPTDQNGAKMQLTPSTTAILSTYNASVDTQFELTLQTTGSTGAYQQTTLVEVSALNCPILMKYKTVAGGTAVSTSSYDEFIQTGTTRHYQIPQGIKVLAFIAQASGQSCILSVIEK